MEGFYNLFHTDWYNELDILEGKDILIVNSKDETKMFRRRAELLRRRFSDGKSLFYPGGHGDFILRPKAEVVREVVRFLTT